MRFNEFGEYNPNESQGCTRCGLCRNVCPFAEGNPNETEIADRLYAGVHGIGRRIECGYYGASFVGYSAVNDHRKNGASGGLLTWTLETLLSRGIVDGVLCASQTGDPDKLFAYVVVDDPADLRRCSKSSYYPLEMSEVLRYAMEREGRYAVTGLPCVIKALRLAEASVPKLAKRLVFHAGIVCGQLPSKFYTEYVARLAGRDPASVRQVTYREKAPDLPATDHLIAIRDVFDSPEPDIRIRHLAGPCFAWEDWFFKLGSCNYCDDVFAETADAVFMDAWLPEYSSKPGGDSLVIARTAEAAALVWSGIESGELNVREIPIERVIASQRPVLVEKRDALAYRLYLRGKSGLRRPGKRVAPNGACPREQAVSQVQHLSMQESSRQAWLHARDSDLSAFLNRIPAYQSRRRAAKYAALRRKARNGMKRALRVLRDRKPV